MPAITVTSARRDQRPQALALLYSRHSPGERAARIDDAFEAARRGELPLDGLLVACDGQRIAGVLLAVFPTHPGGTAFIWPPVLSGDMADCDTVADALLREASRRIEETGAALGQCLLERSEQSERSLLTRNGFLHAADLLYMERELNRSVSSAELVLEGVPFDEPSNANRFAAILERTYIGTRDCPVLSGKRTGREALESHRQTGVFDPQLWNIYRAAGRDIGVLLLAEHPDEDAWEIVYLGVVPEERGRSYGRALAIQALRCAKKAGRARVLLAVDADNHFARRIYDELGFRVVDTRSVFLRFPERRSPAALHSLFTTREEIGKFL
jgi:GNAT superfamily N-acetyltransferase